MQHLQQPDEAAEIGAHLLSHHASNCFDFLRFVFAAAVIYTHSFALLTGDVSDELLVRLSGGQLTFAAAAVAGFFVLSGYLVSASYERSRNVVEYLRKRLLRIYPGFFVASALSLFVVVPVVAPDSRTIGDAWTHANLINTFVLLREPRVPGVFKNLPFHDLNGSLWTIRWEFCCYLLVPVLGWLGALRKHMTVLTIFAIVVAAYAFISYGHLVPIELSFTIFGGPAYGWLRCLAYFLSGVVLHASREKLPTGRGPILAGIIGLIALWHWTDLACLLFGPYLLWSAGRCGSAVLRHWSQPGDFSYGLYLYAWPIQQMLVQYFSRSLSPHLLFAYSVVCTLSFAVASWHCVEQPFLRLKQQK